MRFNLCLATVFTLLLICSITASTASRVTDEFKVTEVFLKADDGRPTGPCPVRVTFRGYITANGPGTIKYTFTRSDGATGPVYIMEFKKAGTQTMVTDWTLGGSRVLPRYAGWQAVKVLSPVEIESSHETGAFEINCGSVSPSAPDKDFVNPARLTADYAHALPALADAQLLLFRTNLEKLKSLNDELELKLTRVSQPAKFDKQRLQEELSLILKEQDREKRDRRFDEFGDRYGEQLQEQLTTAGTDVTTMRQRMASLLGLNSQEISQGTVLNAQRMLAVTSVSEAVADRPPVEAASLFYSDEFAAPFTDSATRGSASANHRDGALLVNSSSGMTPTPLSFQSLSFVYQYVPGRRGARRVVASARIDDLDLDMVAGALFGGAAAEAAISLRVFEDRRLVASTRVSLQRFDVSWVGYGRLNRRLAPVTLECEFNRARPEVTGNYLMVIEFEGLAGSFAFGDARVQLEGKVGPFTVRTY
jgi:hypothetical protein